MCMSLLLCVDDAKKNNNKIKDTYMKASVTPAYVGVLGYLQCLTSRAKLLHVVQSTAVLLLALFHNTIMFLKGYSTLK